MATLFCVWCLESGKILLCAQFMGISQIKLAALLAGPILGVVLGWALVASGWPFEAAVTAAIAWLCAVWWIAEPVPIPVTSLIPIAVFPLFGVLTPAQVGQAYGSPMILLLMGGFILSTMMEKSDAHKKVAMLMVRAFGGASNKRLVLGFMSASALLSMWISNTATTLMLLPIALAVLQERQDVRLAVPLLLGICYAASLGGIGTPIGTPPNLIFMQVYAENTGSEVAFSQWMMWAVPVIIIFLPIMWLWLTRGLQTDQAMSLMAPTPWTVEQKRVLTVFAITALCWMTRKEPFGGWSDWLGLPNANDASVVLIAVVLVFIIPNGRGGRLLDWPTAVKIPWGMLLLFAGGITLAKAFTESGLAAGMAQTLTLLTALPVLVLILCICLAVTFLTEITSNTATTTLLMPIMAIAAVAAGADPVLLMVPTAMSASCAFMLPVATAPNAVMFGSGQVPIQQMVRYGLVLNFIGVAVISLVCYFSLA